MLLPNQSAAEQLLTEATSLSTTAMLRQAITVEVDNGTTNSGWDSLAANRLNYAGYNVQISAADNQNYGTSSANRLHV